MSVDEIQESRFKPSPGLADQIAEHVQRQIVSGVLKAGDRIAEARITRELNVSRGPVREALRVLSRRHLVDLLPRKGARVSEFGPADVIALYDLQETLLNLLVRLVAKRWKPGNKEVFRPLQNQLRRASEEGKPFELLRLSFEFQMEAGALSGNSYLTSTMVDLQPSFSRAYYRALATGKEEMQGIEQFISRLIAGMDDGNVTECGQLVHAISEHQREVVLATFHG